MSINCLKDTAETLELMGVNIDLISIKINTNKQKSKKIFNINKYNKFSWFNSIMLLNDNHLHIIR